MTYQILPEKLDMDELEPAIAAAKKGFCQDGNPRYVVRDGELVYTARALNAPFYVVPSGPRPKKGLGIDSLSQAKMEADRHYTDHGRPCQVRDHNDTCVYRAQGLGSGVPPDPTRLATLDARRQEERTQETDLLRREAKVRLRVEDAQRKVAQAERDQTRRDSFAKEAMKGLILKGKFDSVHDFLSECPVLAQCATALADAMMVAIEAKADVAERLPSAFDLIYGPGGAEDKRKEREAHADPMPTPGEYLDDLYDIVKALEEHCKLARHTPV